MASAMAADVAIGGLRRVAPGVPDRGGGQDVDVAQLRPDAPETTCRKCRLFQINSPDGFATPAEHRSRRVLHEEQPEYGAHSAEGAPILRKLPDPFQASPMFHCKDWAMALRITPDGSTSRDRAAAMAAARPRLALLKAGTLGAGVLALGGLTPGIAGQVNATASGGAAAQSSGRAPPRHRSPTGRDPPRRTAAA